MRAWVHAGVAALLGCLFVLALEIPPKLVHDRRGQRLQAAARCLGRSGAVLAPSRTRLAHPRLAGTRRRRRCLGGRSDRLDLLRGRRRHRGAVPLPCRSRLLDLPERVRVRTAHLAGDTGPCPDRGARAGRAGRHGHRTVVARALVGDEPRRRSRQQHGWMAGDRALARLPHRRHHRGHTGAARRGPRPTRRAAGAGPACHRSGLAGPRGQCLPLPRVLG